MALLKRAAVRAIFSSQSSHLQSCMDMLLLCITGCSKGKNANKAAKRLRRLEDVCRARAEVAGQHATSGGSVLGVTEAPRKAANFRFTIEPARKTISRSTAQTCISLDHRHQQPLVMRQSWHSFPDRRSLVLLAHYCVLMVQKNKNGYRSGPVSQSTPCLRRRPRLRSRPERR